MDIRTTLMRKTSIVSLINILLCSFLLTCCSNPSNSNDNAHSAKITLTASTPTAISSPPQITITYVNQQGESTNTSITINGAANIIEAKVGTTIDNKTTSFSDDNKTYNLTSAPDHNVNDSSPVSISYQYTSSAPPTPTNLTKGRGVIMYLLPSEIKTADQQQEFANLLKKIDNLKYVYIDSYEIVSISKQGEQDIASLPKSDRELNTDLGALITAIKTTINDPDIKILLSSSFSGIDKNNALVFADRNSATTYAGDLNTIAATIGADGIAVDYEPNSKTRNLINQGTDATHVFAYLNALRAGALKLNDNKGLFSIIANKKGFYDEEYTEKLTPIVTTVLSPTECKDRCFASIMTYDLGSDLRSEIDGLSSGINNSGSGLPQVISEHGIPFRVMLPWAYSDYTTPSTEENTGYSYASFLCDISALAHHKWLANSQYPSECSKVKTYLTAPNDESKGIDSRPLVTNPLRPITNPNWEAKDLFDSTLFTGFDGYRVVTKEYAATNPGGDKKNQYLCDGDNSFQCLKSSPMNPSTQELNQYFINPFG